MRRSKLALLAALSIIPHAPARAAPDCQVLAATQGAHWQGEALATSRSLAARSAAVLKEKKGWRSMTVTAEKVKPDPFFKIVRPEGVPDGKVVGTFVTAHAYTTCFTGVVVPFVCTSGIKVCGH